MNKFLLTLSCIALLSCANPGTPGGGPKDTKPPVLTETFPPNYTTRFKATQFTLEFDEYVKLNGGNKAISISPLLKNNPTIIQYGKEIEIQFEKDTLLENTTYTFFFGKNLVDNNEGNPLLNLKYVFSTGDIIDSMKVKGTVTEVETNKPLKDTKVLMYKITDTLTTAQIDSLVLTTKPTYFYDLADTNYFEIQNVSRGQYYLIALKEDDNDFKLVQGKDYIGRYDSLINLKDSTEVHINLFRTLQPFKSFPASFTRANLITFPFLGNDRTRRIVETDSNYVALKEPNGSLHFNTLYDTAYYWLDKENKAEDLMYFLSYDEVNNKVDSHLVTKRNLFLGELAIQPNTVQDLQKDSLQFTTNFPIVQLFRDSIILTQNDTITLTDFELRKDSIDPRILHIHFGVQPDTRYALRFGEKSISSAYHSLKKGKTYKFSTKKLDSYGTVKFRFKKEQWQTDKYILGTYSKTGQLVQQNYINLDKDNAYEYHLKYMPQALYTFKLSADINKDSIWNTGDYFKHISPEPIYFYSDTLEVKSNWDIVQDWDLDTSEHTPKRK